MNYNGSDSVLGLKAIKSDGTIVLPAADGTVTLVAAQYYMPIGTQNAEVPSMCALLAAHLRWSAALRGTLTLELCNFPATIGGQDALGSANADVSDIDVTAGNWVPIGAGDGRVDITPASATVTVLSVGTIVAAGGAFWTLQDMGARRVRWNLNITTGGVVRALARGKVGG